MFSHLLYLEEPSASNYLILLLNERTIYSIIYLYDLGEGDQIRCCLLRNTDKFWGTSCNLNNGGCYAII